MADAEAKPREVDVEGHDTECGVQRQCRRRRCEQRLGRPEGVRPPRLLADPRRGPTRQREHPRARRPFEPPFVTDHQRQRCDEEEHEAERAGAQRAGVEAQQVTDAESQAVGLHPADGRPLAPWEHEIADPGEVQRGREHRRAQRRADDAADAAGAADEQRPQREPDGHDDHGNDLERHECRQQRQRDAEGDGDPPAGHACEPERLGAEHPHEQTDDPGCRGPHHQPTPSPARDGVVGQRDGEEDEQSRETSRTRS